MKRTKQKRPAETPVLRPKRVVAPRTTFGSASAQGEGENLSQRQLEKAFEDALKLDELKARSEPPKNDPVKLKRHSEEVQRLIAEYRRRLQEENETKLQQGHKRLTRTVEEFAKDLIKIENPDITPELLKKPLRELVPFLKRFDWRRHKVTPFVRDQKGCGSCWAFVATEAFESSAMIQRANFAITSSTSQDVFLVQHLSLSVKSTLDCTGGMNNCGGGSHVAAFNHYFEFGVPLRCLKSFPRDEQHDPDFRIRKGQCAGEENQGIKAIGWDYVHNPPNEIPTVHEMKEALLDHGPLAVMVDQDDAFQAYRHPDNNDDAIIRDQQHRFVAYPPDTAPVFVNKEFRGGAPHFVLLIGWDDEKGDEPEGAWIIQNTRGTQWGYQCDGPRVMAADFRSEDRGFMYIRHGTNNLGKFAAWVEAPLLTQSWMEHSESNPISEVLPREGHSASKAAASKKNVR